MPSCMFSPLLSHLASGETEELTRLCSGFPLALSPGHNYTLLGLVIAVSSVILILLSMRLVFMRRRQHREEERRREGPIGYQAEPWMAPGLHDNSNAGSFEMGSLRKSGSTTVVESRPPPVYSR